MRRGAVLAQALALAALLGASSGCTVDASSQCPSSSSGPIGLCSSGSQSAGTAGAGNGSAAASGGASPYANFATVVQIAQVKCGGAGCHAGGDQKPTLLGADNGSLYSTLKTYVVKACGNRLLVKPGAPQDSAFFLAQKGQCGSELPQMPLGCSDDTCVPSDYVEGVRQWIANGAPEH